jgi:hypothetical protein
MRTGSIIEATSILDQTLGKHAHDDALWATKAALLQGAGDARGAYACLAELAARPQPQPMMLIRAGMAALEFEPLTALNLAEQAMRAQPNNLTARKLLCAAYLGVGDAAAAIAECAILLKVTPDDQYLIAMQTTALRLLIDVARNTPGMAQPYQLPDGTHLALERPAQSARPSTPLPIVAPGHRNHSRPFAQSGSGHSGAV